MENAKAKKNEPISIVSNNSKYDIIKTHTEEIVIALCGTIGSPLHKVAETIKTCIEQKYSYECNIIRLSSFIEKSIPFSLTGLTKFDRLNKLIEGGNDLREKYGTRILSELAINSIALHRTAKNNDPTEAASKPNRVCHIIDSIKNDEELEILKLVYGNIFYCIGVSSPISLRESVFLSYDMSPGQFYQLIDRDSGEEINYGQRVNNTFPQSDYFLRIDDLSVDKYKTKIDRFFDLIFNTKITTPNQSETAMYLAATAACNSSCLSRQVGAAITDSNGELISIGWNDVPTYGGNLYSFYDINKRQYIPDARCMNWDEKKCYNDHHKSQLISEIVENLSKNKYIEDNAKKDVENIIKKSKIGELIEFSRSIHAEMHAIIIGSQLAGDRMKGGKLYCTTYPCHNCARHIIVAGIEEVYYIEPYRKSLATKLHSDAITEKENEENKVKLLPFEGVAPNLYYKLFKMIEDSRKINGKSLEIDLKTAAPKQKTSLESFPVLESIVTRKLIESDDTSLKELLI
jgi:deoxycytidylate deaminase